MKRPLIIIIGVVLVFILIGAWMYVLFFMESGDTNTFADLNFENSTEEFTEVENMGGGEPIVNVNDLSRLRQLTTTPVVGFQEVMKNSSSTPLVYYISAGTGHIFSIDLETGEEKRVSGTTIPSTESGVITPDGQYALIQSGFGSTKEATVGMISADEDQLVGEVTLNNIYSFSETASGTFLIARKSDNSVSASHYLPASGEEVSLFSVPFGEVVIDWGTQATDNHYLYPKPNSLLEGYLYQASNKGIKRLPVDGFGLSAKGSNDYVISSSQANKKYSTQILNMSENFVSNYRLDVMPEKCVSLSTRLSFICGISDSPSYSQQTPDDWYQGTVSYNDDLLEINLKDGVNSYLLDIEEESGRILDITNLETNQDDSRLYFINKNDGTLWSYLLTENNN